MQNIIKLCWIMLYLNNYQWRATHIYWKESWSEADILEAEKGLRIQRSGRTTLPLVVLGWALVRWISPSYPEEEKLAISTVKCTSFTTFFTVWSIWNTRFSLFYWDSMCGGTNRKKWILGNWKWNPKWWLPPPCFPMGDCVIRLLSSDIFPPQQSAGSYLTWACSNTCSPSPHVVHNNTLLCVRLSQKIPLKYTAVN